MAVEKRYEFEEAGMLSVFSIGMPGKRTFFLAIGQKDKWVRVWLEKYVLETLPAAVDEFMVTLTREHLIAGSDRHDKPGSEDKPSGMPAAELEIDEMTLGYDHDKATMMLLAHSIGPQRLDGIELFAWVSLPKLEKLSAQAQKIIAAGRPICSLCGTPIDPKGHICPGGN